MALIPTLLTEGGSSSDANSYNTASITPVASTLTLLTVASFGDTTPTATGCGMTWTQIITAKPENTRITVFRGVHSAPSAGALTIDYGGVTVNNCRWNVVSISGANISGTNGANGIIQSNSAQGSATAVTVTLSAISLPQNAVFGAAAFNAGSDLAEGSGFTELSITTGFEGSLSSVWQVGTDNTVDWTATGANNFAAVAMEIKLAQTGLPLNLI